MQMTALEKLWLQLWLIILLVFANGLVALIDHPEWFQ